MQATAVAPLVLRGRLGESALAGKVAIVTGGGGGIGLEAARSLLRLGAIVAIAEIDAGLCSTAVDTLAAESGADSVLGYPADVSDETQVRRLVGATIARFGKVDAVINNATFAPAGNPVVDTSIDDWDRSYAVNLRAPVLLARHCVPAMVERRHGTFVCVSSTGGPFLASYETLKAAQVALANSLDSELAGTGVVAFTIGPGLVPTATATAAIERIAPRLGMTVEEFWRTNSGAVLSVEAAGAGFAAALAMAGRYAGQEISSTQALVDAGIAIDAAPPPRMSDGVAELTGRVRTTLERQAAGWKGAVLLRAAVDAARLQAARRIADRTLPRDAFDHRRGRRDAGEAVELLPPPRPDGRGLRQGSDRARQAGRHRRLMDGGGRRPDHRAPTVTAARVQILAPQARS